MPDVRIRKLPDWVHASLQHQAKQSETSLEEFLRKLLEEYALKSQNDFAITTKQRLAKAKKQFGILPNSVENIREVRNAWG